MHYKRNIFLPLVATLRRGNAHVVNDCYDCWETFRMNGNNN